MSDETKHAPDPLEPLRKMIEKCAEDHRFREHERLIGGYCTCGMFGQTRGQSHDSWMEHFFAAALPALEEAMAIGLCGKHPKMFWQEPCEEIAPQDRESCALVLGHSGPHNWVGPFRNKRDAFCALCAERDAARGEALLEAAEIVCDYCGGRAFGSNGKEKPFQVKGDPNWYHRKVSPCKAAPVYTYLTLDPSAVKR